MVYGSAQETAATATSTAAPEQVPVVTANNQWQPQVQTVGGVIMALVLPGCFMLGDNGEGCRQCFDEPFWIDNYDVTNDQFKQFNGKFETRRTISRIPLHSHFNPPGNR